MGCGDTYHWALRTLNLPLNPKPLTQVGLSSRFASSGSQLQVRHVGGGVASPIGWVRPDKRPGIEVGISGLAE